MSIPRTHRHTRVDMTTLRSTPKSSLHRIRFWKNRGTSMRPQFRPPHFWTDGFALSTLPNNRYRLLRHSRDAWPPRSFEGLQTSTPPYLLECPGSAWAHLREDKRNLGLTSFLKVNEGRCETVYMVERLSWTVSNVSLESRDFDLLSLPQLRQLEAPLFRSGYHIQPSSRDL